MRNPFVFGLIAVLGFLGAIGVFFGARLALIDSSNRNQLQETAQQVVTRAEVAVDLAVMQIGELIAGAQLGCGVESQDAIRRAVFAVGSLKDIHVRTADGHCSGLSDAGLVDPERALDGQRFAGRNETIALTKIVTDGWRGLGVAWRLDRGELIGVMSTDALLFDMLPGALREQATMGLSVSPGVLVANYAPEGWSAATAAKQPSAMERFSAQSTRYPLFVDLDVERSALAAWNHRTDPVFVGAALLFAVAFGTLLARATTPIQREGDALDAAFARGAIVPFVQPIVALGSHRIVGFEVLARWIERDGTVTPPSRFIPLIETSGRSDQLMATLLDSLGRSLGPLLHARPDLKMTINAAPDQFIAPGFAERFIAMLTASGLPARAVVVEITERQEFASLAAARSVVATLSEAGIGVAIDDAGTGHNGLSAIDGLGATTLKVDKFFVDRVDSDQRTRYLIQMLVQVAREFDMSLVAEGIERQEQAAALLAIGVGEGQGYLFARPMPAADIVALIERDRETAERSDLTAAQPTEPASPPLARLSA